MASKTDTEFTVGLVLAPEGAALAVVEKTTVTDVKWDGQKDVPTTDVRYACRMLTRFPPGTSAADIAAQVGVLLRTPSLTVQGTEKARDGKKVAWKRRPTLLVDTSTVGAPFFDAIAATKPPADLVGVVITASGDRHPERRRGQLHYRVPLREVMGAFQILVEDGKIVVDEGLPDAPVLQTALTQYDPQGGVENDVLVRAVSLACWWAAGPFRPTGGSLKLSNF